MGEFTQNLLKLTEFPFSYSLLGLLALISGDGINPNDLSFEKIGPLLILMGFVATTLSICDPIGALQRAMLIGKREKGILIRSNASDLVSERIFKKSISPAIFPAPYLFAIAFSPERIKKRQIAIRWDTVEQTLLQKYLLPEDVLTDREGFERELDKIGTSDIAEIFNLLKGLKQQAVKTKWITAEIDRITALVYFMIIISVFISAILITQDSLSKFAESFGNFESIRQGILIFSFIALVAVVYMFILRIRGLETKTLTVFKYLTALGAIKAQRGKFGKFEANLHDIERYLDDSHWTLAEYWVNRIQADYSEIFLQEVRNR